MYMFNDVYDYNMIILKHRLMIILQHGAYGYVYQTAP
jgi:hypothetical protein